jgi:serine/threonine protein kinase
MRESDHVAHPRTSGDRGGIRSAAFPWIAQRPKARAFGTCTRLGRDVALKRLPEGFSHDPDRIARFRREAQVLASLNQSNIGAIYGLEQSRGAQAIVLDVVEGETLAGREGRA